jgi:hypothetical protein
VTVGLLLTYVLICVFTDSRDYGPVPVELLIGRITHKIGFFSFPRVAPVAPKDPFEAVFPLPDHVRMTSSGHRNQQPHTNIHNNSDDRAQSAQTYKGLKEDTDVDEEGSKANSLKEMMKNSVVMMRQQSLVADAPTAKSQTNASTLRVRPMEQSSQDDINSNNNISNNRNSAAEVARYREGGVTGINSANDFNRIFAAVTNNNNGAMHELPTNAHGLQSSSASNSTRPTTQS